MYNTPNNLCSRHDSAPVHASQSRNLQPQIRWNINRLQSLFPPSFRAIVSFPYPLIIRAFPRCTCYYYSHSSEHPAHYVLYILCTFSFTPQMLLSHRVQPLKYFFSSQVFICLTECPCSLFNYRLFPCHSIFILSYEPQLPDIFAAITPSLHSQKHQRTPVLAIDMAKIY